MDSRCWESRAYHQGVTALSTKTWEQAVVWLREQLDQEALVKACYFDDPLIDAVRRYSESAEWQAVREFLSGKTGLALDFGAGRGISSYALARDGWRVTALEPDSSPVVGAGAIRALVAETGLPIDVVEQRAESMPFEDNAFDLVYGRQILHHATDLQSLCGEAFRVLRRGGIFIATREHVIDRAEDLPAFLAAHPLHRYYGGEHAFMLKEYISAIRSCGFKLTRVLKPFASPINYHPHRFGICMKILGKVLNCIQPTPGRLYSFVAIRP